MQKGADILVFGYGNPGRQDDGLGNEFIVEIDKWLKENGISNIETDSNYQLNIEDAEAISQRDLVLFVDASVEDIEDFCLTEIDPSASKIEFTMHAVSPAFILDLCQKIYQKYPKTYLLHIKGYEMELQEGLTEKGKENLDKALNFAKDLLANPENFENAVVSNNCNK
jgi:hydrogenase maturation protease